MQRTTVFRDTLKCLNHSLSPEHKKNKGTHAALDTYWFQCRTFSTGTGINDICALGFTERAKAPVNVLRSYSKMIGGAWLKLRQCAGHRQRKSLHLPNLLPVLLGRVATRAVLVVGVQVVAVDRRARPIRLRHTPGQHDAAGTLH